MQHIPPWDYPSLANYCAGAGNWYTASASSGACATQSCTITVYSVWSSDWVFCGPADPLWHLVLYLALAGWVLLTAVSLLQAFEWRGLSAYSLSELVKLVGRQVLLLIAACLSLDLLLAAHQLLFLLVNSLVGNLPQWQVESLWGVLVKLVEETQHASGNLDPNASLSQLFGGNLPDNSAPFGMTWGQIFGGLGSFEGLTASVLVPVRFVALFLAVVSAPLAILCYSTGLTRRLFFIWLEFWAEIEGLALGSAIVLAAFQALDHQMGDLSPTEHAFILLALCGLVGGANLVFLWKILGQFLSNVTSFYQQQYQRERQLAGVALQAVVGIAGALATAFTGGAALPAALAAEGLVSGATNLGATPGGAVPGAGVGQAFIGAGRAAATYQRLQSWDAAREDATQQAEARYQAAQTRQQEADARSAMRGAMRQLLPNSLRYSGDEEDDPGLARASPAPSGGGNGSGSRGRASFTGPGAAARANGAHPPRGAAPSPASPPTFHQVAGALLREAQIDWEVRRDILAVLPDSADGLALVQAYAKAAESLDSWRHGGPPRASLIQALQRLAQTAPEEEEDV